MGEPSTSEQFESSLKDIPVPIYGIISIFILMLSIALVATCVNNSKKRN